jgi:plasmid stabilization system protein ParE
MRVRYAARAGAQIDAIHTYIAETNPAAATMVVGRIRAAADRLQTLPRRGRTGKAPGTLEWVVRGLPYIIVYEIRDDENDENEIMILNVFHGAQDR